MLLPVSLDDLRNESDVEQKLLYPLLTADSPSGPGYGAADIQTKANLRQLTIDKGATSKVYRPDYGIVIAGLPLIVIEAKHPDESDLEEALREARLYASELNALHKSGLNPCQRIVACNGKRLITSPADSATVDLDLEFADISQASDKYGKLVELLLHSEWHKRALKLRREHIATSSRSRALNEVGGSSVRDEDIGYNSFGGELATRFLHLFNPKSREERVHVVRNAYVKSNRREHYADEIDHVLRASLPSTVPGASQISDASNPRMLLDALRIGKQLQDKMFLLVGPVGSGKSTFVDYFRETRIPEDIAKSTLWIQVDINEAPPTKEGLDKWIVREIVRKLKASAKPELDVDELEQLLKVFSVELRELEKGPFALLDKDSQKYKDALSDELRTLKQDEQKHAKALGRYLAGERSKLLVLVIDNCDKGDREEQLEVFQTVRWVQSWLKSLVFIPIRDVTYATCKNIPPLDTAIKEFVFQIETPPFNTVLKRRLQLALDELETDSSKRKSYMLQNGMTVVYPQTELGYYLLCIFKSIYEHDKLLRKTIVGLAGKNIRRAMEIFLDFCRSGHIDSQEYLKIRNAHGDYTLPYWVINRVLLRQNRRYYDGDKSYIRNLFQPAHYEEVPDHTSRLAILLWLREHFSQTGPSGIRGFHQAGSLITDLVPFGHDAVRLREDLLYLLSANCLIAEHQRTDELSDDDLICLSSTGFVHLELCKHTSYLAACAEDTWIADRNLAQDIARRIGAYGAKVHYAQHTALRVGADFAAYLSRQVENEIAEPKKYLDAVGAHTAEFVAQLDKGMVDKLSKSRSHQQWQAVVKAFPVGSAHSGKVGSTTTFGVFVALGEGVRGMIHVSELPEGSGPATFKNGQVIDVEVKQLSEERQRIELRPAKSTPTNS